MGSAPHCAHVTFDVPPPLAEEDSDASQANHVQAQGAAFASLPHVFVARQLGTFPAVSRPADTCIRHHTYLSLRLQPKNRSLAYFSQLSNASASFTSSSTQCTRYAAHRLLQPQSGRHNASAWRNGGTPARRNVFMLTARLLRMSPPLPASQIALKHTDLTPVGCRTAGGVGKPRSPHARGADPAELGCHPGADGHEGHVQENHGEPGAWQQCHRNHPWISTAPSPPKRRLDRALPMLQLETLTRYLRGAVLLSTQRPLSSAALPFDFLRSSQQFSSILSHCLLFLRPQTGGIDSKKRIARAMASLENTPRFARPHSAASSRPVSATMPEETAVDRLTRKLDEMTGIKAATPRTLARAAATAAMAASAMGGKGARPHSSGAESSGSDRHGAHGERPGLPGAASAASRQGSAQLASRQGSGQVTQVSDAHSAGAGAGAGAAAYAHHSVHYAVAQEPQHRRDSEGGAAPAGASSRGHSAASHHGEEGGRLSQRSQHAAGGGSRGHSASSHHAATAAAGEERRHSQGGAASGNGAKSPRVYHTAGSGSRGHSASSHGGAHHGTADHGHGQGHGHFGRAGSLRHRPLSAPTDSWHGHRSRSSRRGASGFGTIDEEEGESELSKRVSRASDAASSMLDYSCPLPAHSKLANTIRLNVRRVQSAHAERSPPHGHGSGRHGLHGSKLRPFSN